ncbi:hypothetical protein HQ305_05060 [Rhodococcus sp. BP-149]|uniref:hypothetical protein n=1 Tax=unclassified Rhodococcus (in: high G+C Gram-positive bacteria) TaxID=192944 RepID=UPI001C9AB210|nr:MULTISPECIES: hypothetical protein [unclassified Rhodococcus (in: high G+C Gram-positive bacteria)]MBY6684332.1 hypothetical protein [Rhodococcus sp. BP-288]MBY6693007.1 hypothetical protein [Rhodococcus sp. BP-188]MBY6697204.1 hypothetical protein [Rhodococcus sp. BP-285]MBY6701881.1 hypothetical protein [Rhodococcus sp. BP-283]MBY6710186.1 hypothetical protein [Rhodococcus sp. BP-160]
MGRVVAAGLTGVLLGLLPGLLWIVSAFVGLPPDASVAFPVDGLLVLYGGSVAAAYVLALLAVFLTLRLTSDPLVRRTTTAVAVALPLGAVVATAAALGAGLLFSFDASVTMWSALTIVVVLVLASTFAGARRWAHTDR